MDASLHLYDYLSFVIFLVTLKWCKVTVDDVLLEEQNRYATFSRVGKGGREASAFLVCSRGQQAALPTLGPSGAFISIAG